MPHRGHAARRFFAAVLRAAVGNDQREKNKEEARDRHEERGAHRDLLKMVARDLALASRTVEGRAVVLHDPADDATTTAPRARLPGAVIDGESMLKIPLTAVGANIVPKGRAPGLDRRVENVADRLREA